MPKTLVITDCAECPNAHYLFCGVGCGLCDHRQLDDYPTIPDWCPLPDAHQERNTICDELREYAIGQPDELRGLLLRAVGEIERLNGILAHYEEEAVMPDEIDRIEAAAVAAYRADPNKERDDACDRIEAARRAESSANEAGERDA